jgi:hypothetical protein
VVWVRVTCPKELGGLGILNLTMLRYALRLEWSWLTHTDPGWSWSSLSAKVERLVWAMFDASTIVCLSDGRSALFWQDRWLGGASIQSFAPTICSVVRSRMRATHVVRDAMLDSTWIRDIVGAVNMVAFVTPPSRNDGYYTGPRRRILGEARIHKYIHTNHNNSALNVKLLQFKGSNSIHQSSCSEN